MTTSNTQEPDEELGASEHDKEMIDKSENSDIVDETDKKKEQADPEAVLPEKFKGKSAAEIAKAYEELEAKLGKKKDDEETSEEEDTSEQETTDESTEQDGETKDNPFQEFFDEFLDTGEVSEESYKKLAEQGFPKEMVDVYVDGYKLQVDQALASAHEIVGGEQEYNDMVEWASTNLSQADLDAYTKQLAGGDTQWEIALRGMHSKFVNSGDRDVQRIRGDKGGNDLTTGLKPFKTQAQVTEAMTDPRYRKDPAYQQEVKDRLAISDDNAMGANFIMPKQGRAVTR